MQSAFSSTSTALLLPQYANRWVIAYVLVPFLLGLVMQKSYLWLYPRVGWLEGKFLPWVHLLSIALSISAMMWALYRRLQQIGWKNFALDDDWRRNLRAINPMVILQLSVLVICINLGLSTALQYFLPFTSVASTYTYIPYPWAYRFLQALLLIIAIPILEEFLFRGYVLQSYLRHTGYARAILLSSLIFMSVHLNLYQLGAALTIGIILACRVSLDISLLSACLVHSINNAYALWVTTSTQPSRWQAYTGLIIALMALAIFVIWVYWQRRKVLARHPTLHTLSNTRQTARMPQQPMVKARFISIPMLLLIGVWLLRMVTQVVILIPSG